MKMGIIWFLETVIKTGGSEGLIVECEGLDVIAALRCNMSEVIWQKDKLTDV